LPNLTRGHESTLRFPRSKHQQQDCSGIVSETAGYPRRYILTRETSWASFLGSHPPYLEASPLDVSGVLLHFSRPSSCYGLTTTTLLSSRRRRTTLTSRKHGDCIWSELPERAAPRAKGLNWYAFHLSIYLSFPIFYRVYYVTGQSRQRLRVDGDRLANQPYIYTRGLEKLQSSRRAVLNRDALTGRIPDSTGCDSPFGTCCCMKAALRGRRLISSPGLKLSLPILVLEQTTAAVSTTARSSTLVGPLSHLP
jgi:hypothetical protein